jgi:hypothetical protein
MVPPNLRRLATVFCLWPNRLARDSIGHIARGVMIEKRMLEYIFDQCGDSPHTFILIENAGTVVGVAQRRHAPGRYYVVHMANS